MKADEPAVRPTTAVVGENVQRIRARRGLSQGALAVLLSANGPAWSKGAVATLEAGRRKLLADVDLVQLAATLNVPLAGLYGGDGYVALGGGALITLADLRAALSSPEQAPAVEGGEDVDAIAGALDPMAAEVAARTGLGMHEVSEAAQRLYGQSATAQHRSMVRPTDDPTAQAEVVHRGNITRQLAREIETEIIRRRG